MTVFDTLVRAGRHHATEAPFRSRTIIGHVYDALHLWMIQKEAMDRPIATGYEALRESTNVEPLHAFLAIVATAKELDTSVRMVGVQFCNLGKSESALRCKGR